MYFDGLGKFYHILVAALAVSLPLAFWKLAEIVVWLWNHLHISWEGVP